MNNQIGIITCGSKCHKIDEPLINCTASKGTPHDNHWPVPVSVAIERGYEKCKICWDLDFHEETDETLVSGGNNTSGLAELLK